MMIDRELMQQALEAMEYADACLKKQLSTKTKHEYAQDLLMTAGTALRERLARQELECDGKCCVRMPARQEQEPVDSAEKASAYLDARLWEFIDMAAAWPEAKPDSRTWGHVLVYAPKPAWRDHVEQRLLTWRQSFVNKSGDQLALDDFMDKRSLDDLIDFVCDEYTAPQPAHQPLTEE